MAEKLDATKSICCAEDDGVCCAAGRRGRRRHGRRWRGGRARGEETLLSQTPVGSTVTVTEVLGDESFRGKMIAMGILPGTPICVLNGGARQPLLVAVDGGRFCLDSQCSKMITVRDHWPRRQEGGA